MFSSSLATSLAHAVLLFIAFLILLLLTISVPITKSIFLFKLTAHASSSLLDSSANGYVKFGVLGYCVSTITVSVLGVDHSTVATCSASNFGYIFDSTIAKLLHVQQYANIISKALTTVLVLHPIACVLTFLTLLASLSTLRPTTSRLPALITLILGAVAAFITSLTFIFDIILVAKTRHKVHSDTDGILTLSWGNAVWMALGATLALWIVVIALAVHRWRNRKRINSLPNPA